MFSNFWWNHKKEGKGIHWRKWEKTGKSKQDGGLGFRDMQCFNRALLAKQVWRIHKHPSSLVSQLYKEKYFKHSQVLEVKTKAGSSYIWQGLCSILDLVKKGSVWRVGNGNSIRIWKDKWLPQEKTFEVQTCPNTIPAASKVSCLIDLSNMRWKTEMVKIIFKPEEAKIICSLPISLRGAADSSIWGYTKKGVFMKLVSNLLPTKENLFKKKVLDNPICPVCDRVVESTLHAQSESVVRQSPMTHQAAASFWHPPPSTWLKVNFDASFKMSDSVMGMGIIARDSNGEPHFMLAAQKPLIPSVLMAEAYALLRAFTLCDEMGAGSVVFEGDTKLVVDAVKNSTPDFASHGQLVEDLKHELKTHPNWKLFFTSRGNNKVAHELARLAFSCVTETVWIEEGPAVVSSLISSDKPCVSV
ncbi:hypothetical protein I3843_09G221100 [Carya illinoinensis]|nr:hypothetical protein I3843_09G221100 [Carya illinoinensis]